MVLQEGEEELDAADPVFAKAWGWKGPNRYRAFIWKIIHEKLLTNEERHKRRMTDDALCPRCGDYPDSIMHVLRDCEQVQEFWHDLISIRIMSVIF